MTMPAGIRRTGLALLCAALVGCYSQVPLGLTVPKPETRVIAKLTDIGADRMAQQIGVAATEIEGVVAAADDSTWQLHLIRVDQRGGASTLWSRELVSFPRSMLTGATEKRLNRKASWVFAGAATIGAFLLEQLLTGAFAGDDEGKGGPPPPPS